MAETKFQCPRCLLEFECFTEEVKCPRCGLSASGYNLYQFLRKYSILANDNVTQQKRLVIIKVRKQSGEIFHLIRSEKHEMELSYNSCWFKATLSNLFVDKIAEDPFLYSKLAEFAYKHGLPTDCPLEGLEPQCPQCGSTKTWKCGIRYTEHGENQRYRCRECGYRFSRSQGLNQPRAPVPTYRICVPETKGMKNLVEVESRTTETPAGGTTTTTKRKLTPQEIKGKLVEFSWFMQKEGYRPTTIKGRADCIKNMVSAGIGPDLLNPDAIKGFIAKQSNWEDGYKRNVVYAYTTFLTMHGLTWTLPRYKKTDKIPFIPLETELDQLIQSTGKHMSIFLQGLKETGADPGELHAIRWIDINPQSKTLALNFPVKGHKARILNVSNELIERLNTLPKTSENVFQGNIYSRRRGFHEQRKTAARKFNNPRLLEINFTTYRHWKATMEYHKTKDPYHVKKLLGHCSLKSTEIYIHIEEAIFKETNDQFHVKVAETLDEACKLLEVGFEYVTDMDGKKLFRKRK